MTVRLQILRRTLEQTQTVWREGDDLMALLRAEFGDHAPPHARLFHQYVSHETEVTPTTAEQEAELAALPGPFYLVVSPGVIDWVAVGVAVAMSLASIALQMIFAPSAPSSTNRQVKNESPNNGLSDRANQARVNGRIPYIVGEVNSVPDLIAGTYKIYIEHREREIAYMCIGEGEFEILEAYDDTTPVRSIAGASLEVYAPHTSPNTGHAPQLRIGDAINMPVNITRRINSVNGQTLVAADAAKITRSEARFESPNVIRNLNPDADYTQYFVPGDRIQITEAAQAAGLVVYTSPDDSAVAEMASSTDGRLIVPGNIASQWPSGAQVIISNSDFVWTQSTGGDGDFSYDVYGDVNGVYILRSATDFNQPGRDPYTELRLADVNDVSRTWSRIARATGREATGEFTITRQSDIIDFDLSGTYTVNTVATNVITLDDPASVNPDWQIMADNFGGQSNSLRPVIATTGERWQGWFVVEMQNPITSIIANVVALNGLYGMDSSGNQHALNVSYRIEAEPLDEFDNPIGPIMSWAEPVMGSAISRTGRASTMRVDLTSAVSNRWRFRGRRVTPTSGQYLQVIDTIQWQDLYTQSPLSGWDFGNVTTVQTSTYANDGSLAIKERRTNLDLVRKLPILNADGSFGPIAPTRDIKDIFCALCLDPRIGNRSVDEIDLANVYQTSQEIKDYFGFEGASHFSYTFDKADMSFEETATATAAAVYCRAYRRGSVLRLFFERETNTSSMLFNHRNKLPGTEKRKRNFGPLENYDGVAYQYVNPDDDLVKTLYIPGPSPVNPKTIESVGIRRHDQAHIHAWREWNKIRYQHTITTFDGLQEADMLTLSERVIDSDTTRRGEQAGYVRAVDGLLLHLSQVVDWPPGAPSQLIFVQNSDMLVESIEIAPGPDSSSVILSRAPRTPIVVSGVAPTRYIIGANESARQVQPFLVQSKEYGDGQTVSMTLVNYDARYYANDGDYRG